MPAVDVQALEAVSDAVDDGWHFPLFSWLLFWLTFVSLTVNKLKGSCNAWDSSSAFDADKDKASFRQYTDACDRVKNFYREQHRTYYVSAFRHIPKLILKFSEKQTMEFNLKARANFNKSVRARMGK